MMTETEAIFARHSVRSYRKKPIEKDTAAQLKARIDEWNALSGLRLQLLEDAGDTYGRLVNRVMGLGSAPSVIACVGTDAPDLDERVGYWGEKLVLYAQQLGLNTCWTGVFDRKGIPLSLQEGERLVIAIAIGYGVNGGKPRRSKRIDQVAMGENRPAWFDYAVSLALLAPTAINQQRFEIRYDGENPLFLDKGGPFSRVDLGIVKYHFEVGSVTKTIDKCLT